MKTMSQFAACVLTERLPIRIPLFSVIAAISESIGIVMEFERFRLIIPNGFVIRVLPKESVHKNMGIAQMDNDHNVVCVPLLEVFLLFFEFFGDAMRCHDALSLWFSEMLEFKVVS